MDVWDLKVYDARYEKAKFLLEKVKNETDSHINTQKLVSGVLQQPGVQLPFSIFAAAMEP